MLYKKIPNVTGGEYRNKTTLERCDLITAEIRFYCPIACGKVCGGEEDACCKRFDTVEEAMLYFNLEHYVLQ